MSAPVFLTAAWRSLVMLNFDIAPHLLTPHVPRGAELDLFDDRALLSLVGFRFLDTRLRGWCIPGYRDFSEVNLRFYVRRETANGWRRGVVFLKEVAPRHAVTFVARRVYHENYVTLPVHYDLSLPKEQSPTGHGEYRWGPRDDELHMHVALRGEPALPAPQSEAEFVIEHYWGYSRQPDGSTLEYEVEHPRWNIWPALAAELRGNAAALYGDTFADALGREPSSAFLVDGSNVAVHCGVPLQ